jgi:hypothetical protein
METPTLPSTVREDALVWTLRGPLLEMISTRAPRCREAVAESRGTSSLSMPLERAEATVAWGFRQWVYSSSKARLRAPSGSHASCQKLVDAPPPTRTEVIERYRGRRRWSELQWVPHSTVVARGSSMKAPWRELHTQRGQDEPAAECSLCRSFTCRLQALVLNLQHPNAQPAVLLRLAHSVLCYETLGAGNLVRGSPEEGMTDSVQSRQHARGQFHSTHCVGRKGVEDGVDQPKT